MFIGGYIDAGVPAAALGVILGAFAAFPGAHGPFFAPREASFRKSSSRGKSAALCISGHRIEMDWIGLD